MNRAFEDWKNRQQYGNKGNSSAAKILIMAITVFVAGVSVGILFSNMHPEWVVAKAVVKCAQ